MKNYLQNGHIVRVTTPAGGIASGGARVSWDNTTKEVTTPAAGRFPIGVAVEAAGNGATSVAVRLDGIATAAA
ncbi:uncharacterized protein DUF2190 [Rhodovulum imhoffii]|uniref:Uncharacterized protein DUF2190 n=1 Tax=Rhodovulum imhoffii TaxID=365340 RepID=A0A2T5BNM5_9RHOB|nr:DUF2190 family protein [Rhodovulum imhoffii]MBK5932416.1 hypothetical protein [Rhodovulum imhoffii]PTN00590.1 uncharacterized protein DUF2190 [Rhodovulum imhoffii]